MGKGTTIGHFLNETDRACQRGDHLWFDLNTLEWLQIIHGRKKSFYFNRFWDYIDFIFSSPLFSGTKDSFRLFTSSKPIDMRKYYRSSVTKKVSARVIEAPWQKSSSCKRSSWLFQAVLLYFVVIPDLAHAHFSRKWWLKKGDCIHTRSPKKNPGTRPGYPVSSTGFFVGSSNKPRAPRLQIIISFSVPFS